jgi:hypothetical protein
MLTGTNPTTVIRGLRDGQIIYVFAPKPNGGGFQIAAEHGLEGIPFGESTARFIHMWGTNVHIPPELTNKPLFYRELKAEHPEILTALDAEHEALVTEGQAKMQAPKRKVARHAFPRP